MYENNICLVGTRIIAVHVAPQVTEMPGQQQFLCAQGFLLEKMTPLQLLWAWQPSKL